MKAKKVVLLLNESPVITTGEMFGIWTGFRTIQASISGVGQVHSEVEIYGSNLEKLTTGILLAALTLDGTDNDNTGDIINAEYAFMWAKITAISGIDAKVTVTVSV